VEKKVLDDGPLLPSGGALVLYLRKIENMFLKRVDRIDGAW
jgi:hypothetical protein